MIFLWIIWVILTLYLFFRRVEVNNFYMLVPGEEIGDTQNVHDTVVRSIGTEKYFYLFSKMEAEYNHLGRGWLKTLENNAMNDLKKYREFSELYQALQKEETFVFSFSFYEPEMNTNGIAPISREIEEKREIEIFALVWTAFKKLDNKILIAQLHDCYENGELVCLNGRIARYLTAFVGVTDDILGKPEVTEKILFEEALRETEQIFKTALEKSAFKNVYINGGNEKEEEQLDAELSKIKSQIKRRLKRAYPQLCEKKINELLLAI
jgi:hypothetical protein